MNPAALALALLLGHEARITDEQWEDVMALSRTCPHCGGTKCDLCDQRGWIMLPDLVLRDVENYPQVTHHCPTCEAAARERDALNALCDKQAAILSRVAVALRGPEPPQTRWSHHDLPERAERAAADAAHYRKRWADSVLMHTDAVTQRDDLRARLDALAIEMETDDRAGRLAHWITAVRAIAEKEAK